MRLRGGWSCVEQHGSEAESRTSKGLRESEHSIGGIRVDALVPQTHVEEARRTWTLPNDFFD